MTSFTTSGSAVTFDTSGTAVTFAVTTAPTAFTTSPTVTPGAHASTHGAGGADPITTLGTVTTTLGTVTTLASTTATLGGATITAGTATTLTMAAGSAGGPSIRFTGDTNTGIYSPGADQVGIATAGTARVVVDASGRLGVANAAPTARLDVSNDRAALSYGLAINTYNGASFENSFVAQFDGAVQLFGNYQNFPIGLIANNTERFRVDGAGLITGTGTSLGAWTSYTPTVTASSGSYTSVSATTYYTRIGKIIIWRGVVNITTNGTAAGVTFVTLPVAAAAAVATGAGRETNVTGAQLQVFLADTSKVGIVNYGNGYEGSSGAAFQFALTYEA